MSSASALPRSAVAMDEMPSPTGAKALALFDLLSRHGAGLTLAEAPRRTGFTRNLVFRPLKTLVPMGYATQREDNKAYVLTNRLLELTGPRSGDRSLSLCAHKALRWLRDETGETVQLAIEQFRGTHALQVCGEVGMRNPLPSCAPGKAILAQRGEDRLETRCNDRGRTLKRFTATTLASRGELLREWESIRRVGDSIDRAKEVEGIHCVATPIFDEYRQTVGAIAVMAPLNRMPEEEFKRFAGLCRAAADRIERKLK